MKCKKSYTYLIINHFRFNKKILVFLTFFLIFSSIKSNSFILNKFLIFSVSENILNGNVFSLSYTKLNSQRNSATKKYTPIYSYVMSEKLCKDDNSKSLVEFLSIFFSNNIHHSYLCSSLVDDNLNEISRNKKTQNNNFKKRSGKWVLVVDDVESIRTAIGQYLFDVGFQVTACDDGISALNVCMGQIKGKSRKYEKIKIPDAIVSDVRMNVMGGLEFVKRLRSDERLACIPVVLLNTRVMTVDRIKGYDSGADYYLSKPVDPEELLTVLDNLIKRRKDLNGDDLTVDVIRKDLDIIKTFILEAKTVLFNEHSVTMIGDGKIGNKDIFLFSPDEMEVLKLLCRGWMNKEIATEMRYSVRRVEQHLTGMYRKTECSGRTELIRWVVLNGYIMI